MMQDGLPTIPADAYPILLGIVGSRLYGTDHEGSDTDWKGIYQAPTREILGIRGTPDSYNFHHPDFTLYELGKAVDLLLKCNPTMVELLHMPSYEILTPQGEILVENRSMFLWGAKTAAAYRGFAYGQRRDLVKGKHTRKSVRHLFRVLWQGEELLSTGICTPRMTPEQIEQANLFAALDQGTLLELVDEALIHFDDITRESVLPEYPDLDAINDLLVGMRVNWAPDPLDAGASLLSAPYASVMSGTALTP